VNPFVAASQARIQLGINPEKNFTTESTEVTEKSKEEIFNSMRH